MKTKLLYFLIFIPLITLGQNKKTLFELTNTNESAWKLVQNWIKNAEVKVVVLPKDIVRANIEIETAQVTTQSPMGAIIFETGGIIIESGIIRILGSGNVKLNRGLMEWNRNKSFSQEEKPKFLLIADDVFGGFFAINGGSFSSEYLGKVFYFAPDTLQWENLDLNYSDFLVFCFSKDINEFYSGFKWKTFDKSFNITDFDKSYSFYPYLFTEEGKDINSVTKNLVPISELWTLYNDLQNQFPK
ncbi:DUF2625 family protein [Flavobacterium nackdongense]|uniref:DUF2625 family protein n=1 Tax=Flavobacterium nackdongense TaxID=2547394 RepID=A0A4P6YFE5_9FLAO|nr:DUF2625 family protein [Flavobacterium nackdongense]QBN19487.1 DUF2625 family protein [Flavobacterium nackdongense]